MVDVVTKDLWDRHPEWFASEDQVRRQQEAASALEARLKQLEANSGRLSRGYLGGMSETIGKVTRDFVHEYVAEQLKPLKAEAETLAAENAAMRAEIAGLKAQPQMVYRGVWKPGEEYATGSVCTWEGSAWCALRDTDQKPGNGGSSETGWQLAVKRGSDAPKGAPATPRPVLA
jgi:hypothetical protein